MAVGITKLKEYLFTKIDPENPLQVEKVERYMKLVQLIRKLVREVDKDGVVKVTKNASQEFTKAHPALAEINKLNAQLLSLEKSFGLDEKDTILPEKDRPSLL